MVDSSHCFKKLLPWKIAEDRFQCYFMENFPSGRSNGVIEIGDFAI
jgi:hypothetical protein